MGHFPNVGLGHFPSVATTERHLLAEGHSFGRDGTLRMPSSRGAPPKYVNRVIDRLYDPLSLVRGSHGRSLELQRDIQALLDPILEVDLERIRAAIDNYLR